MRPGLIVTKQDIDRAAEILARGVREVAGARPVAVVQIEAGSDCGFEGLRRPRAPEALSFFLSGAAAAARPGARGAAAHP